MPFEKIEHNGRIIYHNDLRGTIDPKVQIAVLDAYEQAMLVTIGNVLVLTDVTDGKGSTAFMEAANRLGKKFDHRVDKEAVVGATGIKKILLQGYIAVTGHQSLKPFDTREEALEWLTDRASSSGPTGPL